MSKSELEEYVQCLLDSGLATRDQVSTVLSKVLQEAQGEAVDRDYVARRFQAADLVTPWQHQKLLLGRYKGFFLGNYKLLDHIATGGMSNIYLAEHLQMKRRVAIKVLPPSLTENSSYLDRFYVESRAIARLDHPNIVRAYDIAKDGNFHFLVLEYVEGQDLRARVKKTGPLAIWDAVDYTRQAARGLAHAHERGIIHRDIKPANLLVDRRGVVKLLDMGLTRIREEGATSVTLMNNERLVGTIDFIAPEQSLDSHNVDTRADIYSLGCTLYYFLAGHAPFHEGNQGQRLMQHQFEEPESLRNLRPEVPEELEIIIRKMMAKKPQLRYQTAGELAEVLEQFLDEASRIHPSEDDPTNFTSEERPWKSLSANPRQPGEAGSTVFSHIGHELNYSDSASGALSGSKPSSLNEEDLVSLRRKLDTRRDALDGRESILSSREARLKQRAAQLDDQQAEIERKERIITAKESQIRHRESRLEVHNRRLSVDLQHFEHNRARFRKLEEMLEQRTRVYQAREHELRSREERFKARALKMKEHLKKLTLVVEQERKRMEEVLKREQDLNRLEEELREREAALLEHASNSSPVLKDDSDMAPGAGIPEAAPISDSEPSEERTLSMQFREEELAEVPNHPSSDLSSVTEENQPFEEEPKANKESESPIEVVSNPSPQSHPEESISENSGLLDELSAEIEYSEADIDSDVEREETAMSPSAEELKAMIQSTPAPAPPEVERETPSWDAFEAEKTTYGIGRTGFHSDGELEDAPEAEFLDSAQEESVFGSPFSDSSDDTGDGESANHHTPSQELIEFTDHPSSEEEESKESVDALRKLVKELAASPEEPPHSQQKQSLLEEAFSESPDDLSDSSDNLEPVYDAGDELYGSSAEMTLSVDKPAEVTFVNSEDEQEENSDAVLSPEDSIHQTNGASTGSEGSSSANPSSKEASEEDENEDSFTEEADLTSRQ
ncbi:Hypothetical protein PBC10988_33260 [Planctomycetales bacterium 10988]|nr:Hypothetical protein PBC10988_33260 [Planctomycetales bacterium 10988]